MEMTLEQKRALALASARKRAAEAQQPSTDIFNDFAGQAAKLDPTDLSIARSKNDAFGEYLRGQALAPRVESQERREARLYGAPMQGTSKTMSGLAGAADMAAFGFADEMGAGMASAFGPNTYDQELSNARQSLGTAQAENPYSYLGGQVAGGIASGLVTAPLMPGGGGPLIDRMARGGLAGAGQGTAYGFGSGEGGVKNRLTTAALNAAIGAGGGAAAPVLASGARGIYNWGANKLANSDAISGISSAAQRYLVNNLADPQVMTAMRGKLDELGPDATFADVSPEWLGVARGAAARPETRGLVVPPLEARQAAANARLGSALDENLGRAIIPSQVDDALAQGQEAIAARYPQVMRGGSAVDTQPLANALDSEFVRVRGPQQEAVQRVRRMLNIPGTDQLDPNPNTLLSTRNAIDGLFATETNPQVIRQLSAARQQVDDELARVVPGIKEVDAPFAELARQRQALTQGRTILNNEASAMRPQELQDILTQGGLPEGQMVGPSAASMRARQGVRAEIDRAVGTNANDVTALKKIVRGEGDWNREKLGMMFGQDRANNALSAIDREVRFGDTANRVTRGSDTAMASRFGKFLDDTENAGTVPTDSTLLGYSAKAAKAVLSGLMNRNAGNNASRYAKDIGRLSVATGQGRDAVLDSLMQRGQRNVDFNDPAKKRIADMLARSLLVGSTLPIAGTGQ